MKKVLFILLILIFGKNLEAQDGLGFKFINTEYNLNMGVGFSFSVLNLKEFVFENNKSDKRQSEIDWIINSCGVFDLKLDLKPSNELKNLGLFFSLNSSWYFPSGAGNVLDVDWDEKGNRFSEVACNIFLEDSFIFDGLLGVGIPINNVFLMKAGAGVWYSRFYVKALNGYVNQVNRGEDWNYKRYYDLYGMSMSYIQEWIILKPEAGFMYESKKMRFGLDFEYSPLIWGNCIDNHFFKKEDEDDKEQKYLVYEDKLKQGYFLGLDVYIDFILKKNLILNLFFDFKTVKNTRGDTDIKTTGLAGYHVVNKGMAGGGIDIYKYGFIFNFKYL